MMPFGSVIKYRYSDDAKSPVGFTTECWLCDEPMQMKQDADVILFDCQHNICMECFLDARKHMDDPPAAAAETVCPACSTGKPRTCHRDCREVLLRAALLEDQRQLRTLSTKVIKLQEQNLEQKKELETNRREIDSLLLVNKKIDNIMAYLEPQLSKGGQ